MEDVYYPKKRAGPGGQQVNYKPEPYEIRPSKRGHHLVAGNFKYMMNRQKNEIKYFACIHRGYPHKCKGTGKLDVESNVFYSINIHSCDKPLPIDDDYP